MSSSSSMAGSAETHQATDPLASHPTLEVHENPQAVNNYGSQNSHNAAQQMFPILYPLLVPGAAPLQKPEQNDQGAGLYAVPFYPFMGAMAGSSPSTLIPIKYTIPTRTNSAGAVGEVPGQEARPQHGPQRQVVVRRFQFAIQLDLALILKLAAAVFLFNQDGSRQRLTLLVFFATLVYLYQTGVLAPLIRWIRRGAPPRPRPAVQQENVPPVGHGDGNDPLPEETPGPGVEDQNRSQPAAAEDPPAVHEEQPEPERRNGINWWGIAKEIQTIVVGFIISLIPGFHNND